jgi:hypothetical protein
MATIAVLISDKIQCLIPFAFSLGIQLWRDRRKVGTGSRERRNSSHNYIQAL